MAKTDSAVRHWRLICCAMVLVFVGCKSDDEAAKGVTTTAPVQIEQAPEARAALADEPASVEPADSFDDVDSSEEVHPRDESADVPMKEVSAPSRDLPTELKAALGSPVDCVQDYRPNTPTTVRVSISATVRPSGLVIEPSANGRGLSYNDRKCIEERVGSVVLAPLATQESQPLSTFMELDLGVGSPTVEEDDVGGPAPRLEDVVEPLPKKKTIPPSGVPIQKAPSDKIEGPKGVPIEGPEGVPVEGPKPTPIEGYEVEEDAEQWTDE